MVSISLIAKKILSMIFWLSLDIPADTMLLKKKKKKQIACRQCEYISFSKTHSVEGLQR